MNIVYTFLSCVNPILSCVFTVLSCVNSFPSCVKLINFLINNNDAVNVCDVLVVLQLFLAAVSIHSTIVSGHEYIVSAMADNG